MYSIYDKSLIPALNEGLRNNLTDIGGICIFFHEGFLIAVSVVKDKM